MAHITGGGFPDNLPRVLPEHCRAIVDRKAWRVPAVFDFIMRAGNVGVDEMYRVFNMGIGFVLFMRPQDVPEALNTLKAQRAAARVIGRVEAGRRGMEYA